MDAKKAARLNAKMPEVWGTVRVARELEVEPSNLDRVSKLPLPFQQDENRRLWRADVIREFAEARRERKNRRKEKV